MGEEPNFWVRKDMDRTGTPEPVSPEKEAELHDLFMKSTRREREALFVIMVVLWVVGVIGCYGAGLVLHEVAHF